MKSLFTSIATYLFTGVLLAGCSPTVVPSVNENPPSITQDYQVEIINLTEPVYETIRTENIDQPNCNGTGDVDNAVERTMGINHSIEVGLGLSVDVDGKLELFGTGVDLGAAISSELGYQYGITESISRSITVRAAPNSHIIHTIKLSEVWETGTARVTSNGQSIDIPFRFRANFSIDLVESVPVDCATGEILVPQSVNSPAPALEPASQPSSTPQISSSQDYTTQDLDTILGAGKWHCVDGFSAAVSIDNVPFNFVVQSPFIRVDKNDKFYYPGETVPSGGYATGWLVSNLPNSNCSPFQSEVTQNDINSLLGSGNWYCLTQYPTGVKVRSVPSNFTVISPAIFVDKNDIRYYKGDAVPSGGTATVWFSNEIPTGECP